MEEERLTEEEEKFLRSFVDAVNDPTTPRQDDELQKIAQGIVDETKATLRAENSEAVEYINIPPNKGRGEENFVAKRRRFMGRTENHPVIALATSGGSMRAMIAEVGFLQGCKDIGLLDKATYVSALSGSSWTLSTWFASDIRNNPFVGEKDKEPWELSVLPNASGTTIDEAYLEKLISMFEKKTLIQMGKHVFEVAKNWLARTSKRSADLWGLIVGRYTLKTLGDRAFTATYSQCRVRAETGCYPIPICTAACKELPNNEREWVEYTPWAVSLQRLEMCTPLEAFGQPLVNGSISTKRGDENLYFYHGLWGSAYTATFDQILESLPQDDLQYIRFFIKKLNLGSRAPFRPTKTCNPYFNVDNHPYSQLEYLHLNDAGTVSNIPLPPLLHRNVDLVVVFDCTEQVEKGIMDELEKLKPWYKPNPASKHPTQHIYVIKGQPTIVYIPFMKLSEFGFNPTDSCPTTKLFYEKDTIIEAVKLAQNLVLNAKEQIFACIDHVQRKKDQSHTNQPNNNFIDENTITTTNTNGVKVFAWTSIPAVCLFVAVAGSILVRQLQK